MSKTDEILVRMYADLIRAGRRTLGEAPERLRDGIKDRLEALGYVGEITG